MGNPFITWALARLKEPSSWAGLAALMGSLGLTLSAAQSQALITLGIAVAGFVAVMMPEKK